MIPAVSGTLTAAARVAGNEPNPNPAVAVAAVSTPVAAPPPAPMADLLVTKAFSPNPATVGVPLTYTVTVTNLGPDAEPAAGVTVVDVRRARPRSPRLDEPGCSAAEVSGDRAPWSVASVGPPATYRSRPR